MTEEQAEPEIINPPEPQEIIEVELPENPEQPKEPEEKKFDPKKDKVEFSTPEQEARFKAIHYQLRKSDERNKMLTDFLHQQSEIIDGVRKDQNQANDTEAEKAILARISKAREESDDTSYDKAFAELVDFRSEKKFERKFEEKLQKISKQEKEAENNQAKFIASAMEERDEAGNYKRPWLQEDNPDFGMALYHISAIARKYENDPGILEKTLADLDKTMTGGAMPKKPESNGQLRAPNPMQGTNLTNKSPERKIKMTRKELEIVRQLERHSGRKIDLSKYAARRSTMGGQNG